MIQRSDILSIPFMKKMPFTGSCQGMRYRMERSIQNESEVLLVQVWEGPYSFEITQAEQRQKAEFSFDEEGICQSVEWLNRCWSQEKERWKKAQGNWEVYTGI